MTDEDDMGTIITDVWFHMQSGNYVARNNSYTTPRTLCYLHNDLMGTQAFGRGAITSYDHLNRIGTDNRRANLEFKSQSDQNHNQRRRRRNTVLPPDCRFTVDDMPQHIYYTKASTTTTHGEYCYIEIKHNCGKVYDKKSTKSAHVPLIDKLNAMKLHLKRIMITNPEWFEGKCQNGDLVGGAFDLYHSYYEILKVAGVQDPLHPFDSNMGNHTKMLLEPSVFRATLTA